MAVRSKSSVQGRWCPCILPGHTENGPLTEAIVRSTSLPVTVKTRLGWNEQTKFIVDVAERLQDVGIQALSIHGRTRQQMYKGEADWTLIGEVEEQPENAHSHFWERRCGQS